LTDWDIVADKPVSMQMTEAIRQRAGYGPAVEQPQDSGAEVESAQAREVDFGAGARQHVPSEPSMSEQIRAAARGWTVRGGGVK
jgi:hypothetical protein